MAGEENRKIFFNDKNLDLSGYHILLGGIPNLKDIEVDSGLYEDIPETIKRLLPFLHKERIKECAPKLYVSFAETDSFCLSNSTPFGRH